MQDIDQLQLWIVEFKTKLKAVEDTIALVEELRKKLNHEVMVVFLSTVTFLLGMLGLKVPVNDIGFFEGHITDTKTVRVDLGCHIVVECSTDHALTILERRKRDLGILHQPQLFQLYY